MQRNRMKILAIRYKGWRKGRPYGYIQRKIHFWSRVESPNVYYYENGRIRFN